MKALATFAFTLLFHCFVRISFRLVFNGVKVAKFASIHCLEVLHRQLGLIMTTHEPNCKNCENDNRRISMRALFTCRYGVDRMRFILTSAEHSIDSISYP